MAEFLITMGLAIGLGAVFALLVFRLTLSEEELAEYVRRQLRHRGDGQ